MEKRDCKKEKEGKRREKKKVKIMMFVCFVFILCFKIISDLPVCAVCAMHAFHHCLSDSILMVKIYHLINVW